MKDPYEAMNRKELVRILKKQTQEINRLRRMTLGESLEDFIRLIVLDELSRREMN